MAIDRNTMPDVEEVPASREGERAEPTSSADDTPRPPSAEASSAPSPDLHADESSSSSEKYPEKETEAHHPGEPEPTELASARCEGELLFAVENVAVHPSASVSKRIRGRLRLMKQGASVYLSWVPYNSVELDGESSGSEAAGSSTDAVLEQQQQQQRHRLYTIRAVALSEIRSIRRHTPPLGWHFIIIVLNSGLAFPPLYFYDGSVRAFISTLKQHASVVKSADDPNVYIITNADDPLERSLGSMQLDEHRPGMLHASASSIPRLTLPRDVSLPFPLGPARTTHHSDASNAAPPDKTDLARDLPLQVLERFARVTKLARNVFMFRKSEEQLLGGPDAADRMPYRSPTGKEKEKEAAESAALSEEGTESTDVGQFEIVKDPLEELLTDVWPSQRPPPLSYEEWVLCLDAEGRVADAAGILKRIYCSNVEPELRKEAWKFILGVYPWNSTYEEREKVEVEKRQEYLIYKSQWQSVTPAQARRFCKYRERVSRIDKDVVRTDRTHPWFQDDNSPHFDTLRSILLTYSFYNFDLGYCQGMSDLLSPFLVVMEDECDAFWCFAAFMEKMGPNFNRDQAAMRNQLCALDELMRLLDAPLHDYLLSIDATNFFCCFRWLLILFKREFEFNDVLRLWEVLWTCPYSEHLHLYICTAILKKFRRNIFDEQMEFDTLLKFINDLSGRLSLDEILYKAEALCRWAGPKGEAVMPPPPGLPLDLIEGPETGDSTPTAG